MAAQEGTALKKKPSAAGACTGHIELPKKGTRGGLAKEGLDDAAASQKMPELAAASNTKRKVAPGPPADAIVVSSCSTSPKNIDFVFLFFEADQQCLLSAFSSRVVMLAVTPFYLKAVHADLLGSRPQDFSN